jgi:membrane protein DedA with SNARE-associated domain
MTRPFTTIAAIIFAAMAVVHGWRLIKGFDVVVDGHGLPQWVSVIGIVLAALMAVMLWRESRR